MDWDHLRFFGELARNGSMAAAARRLGVEHTTVSRRIKALEKQLGAVLFARESGQWRLTEAGRQLLTVTDAMQSAVDGLERGPLAQSSASEGPAGLVRVGATEGFGTQMLAGSWRGSLSATPCSAWICWRCRACCICRVARPIS